MTLEIIRDMLAWCTVINLIILLLWVIAFINARDWMYGIHRKWFALSEEAFDIAHYAGMGLFKILFFVFNLAPYLALRIIG